MVILKLATRRVEDSLFFSTETGEMLRLSHAVPSCRHNPGGEEEVSYAARKQQGGRWSF